LVDQFEHKLNGEQAYFEKEMANVEKRENDPKVKN
jgi:hypothetical protein